MVDFHSDYANLITKIKSAVKEVLNNKADKSYSFAYEDEYPSLSYINDNDEVERILVKRIYLEDNKIKIETPNKVVFNVVEFFDLPIALMYLYDLLIYDKGE